MKVHHLNCATLCPPLARYLRLPVNAAGRLVCHCLLLECAGGLVLVDTGLGLADVAPGPWRMGRLAGAVLGPRRAREETAVAQLEALGFDRRDVRHVIVTHLDLDHAGGLADFPDAHVHLHAEELAAAQDPTRRARARYRELLWSHGARFVPHAPGGEDWLGFSCVRDLPGLPPEVLLVPLEGHTRGHSGVAVATAQGWLLHAGDAYFARGELQEPPTCPASLRVVQRLDDHDGRARRENQARLRRLAHERAGEVRIFCAHDPDELGALRASTAARG